MDKTFLLNFEEICRRRGYAPSTALKAAGLSNSLYTKWNKNPETVPNLTTLKLLADTLHVSIDELAYGDPDPEYLSDLRNYPAFYELIKNRTRMTQAQMEEILRYAKYIAPEAFNDL